jgi:hypothetical protein
MSVENDLLNTKIYDRVKKLLLDYENVRDQDKMLWIAYCQHYLGLQSHIEQGYHEFCNWLMLDMVPTFESISRARRKAQERHPGLRGKHYKAKQKSSEVIAQWAVDN